MTATFATLPAEKRGAIIHDYVTGRVSTLRDLAVAHDVTEASIRRVSAEERWSDQRTTYVRESVERKCAATAEETASFNRDLMSTMRKLGTTVSSLADELVDDPESAEVAGTLGKVNEVLEMVKKMSAAGLDIKQGVGPAAGPVLNAAGRSGQFGGSPWDADDEQVLDEKGKVTLVPDNAMKDAAGLVREIVKKSITAWTADRQKLLQEEAGAPPEVSVTTVVSPGAGENAPPAMPPVSPIPTPPPGMGGAGPVPV